MLRKGEKRHASSTCMEHSEVVLAGVHKQVNKKVSGMKGQSDPKDQRPWTGRADLVTVHFSR